MTHPEITSRELRHAYASELVLLRSVARRMDVSLSTPYYRGLMVGLETAFRRMSAPQPEPDYQI